MYLPYLLKLDFDDLKPGSKQRKKNPVIEITEDSKSFNYDAPFTR